MPFFQFDNGAELENKLLKKKTNTRPAEDKKEKT